MSIPDFYPKTITDPADLALSRADRVMGGGYDVITDNEGQLLNELDEISTAAGFDGSYFVEAGQAFAIPLSWERGQPVKLQHFSEGLSFEGELSTYGVMKIGRLAVAGEDIKIKALCLVFGGGNFIAIC